MHDKLIRRHLFTGVLVFDTALHLGGGVGATGAQTDSPVYRDHLGRPLIPGSSLKGAFRSAIERLTQGLALVYVCGEPGGCFPPKDLQQQKSTWEQDGLSPAQIDAKISELLLGNNQSKGKLCDACLLFGYPAVASRALFADLPLVDGSTDPGGEIRDGVAIERDSGRAADRLKYDYEVIPAGTRFTFRLTVENATDEDLGLIAIGLRELEEGMVPLGGMRTRGLGRCHLEGLEIRLVNFEDRKRLLAYLLNGKDGMEKEPNVRATLEGWIKTIVEE